MGFDYKKYRAAQFGVNGESSPLAAKELLGNIKSGASKLFNNPVTRIGGKILNHPAMWALEGLDLISKAMPEVKPGLEKRAKRETEGGSQYTSRKL